MLSASLGQQVAWITPTYKNSRPLWRWAERIAVLCKEYGVKAQRAERMLEFPNGGSLSVYSADNISGILGSAFHLLIVDEAARVAEEAWTDAMQPTLADYDGDAILISTPKGRNWFWQEFVKAKSDGKETAAFTAPTSANPSPNIRKAFALAKERVSERTYRQEWLAEFVSDGTFFQNVEVCATAEPQTGNDPSHAYCIGVDWARASGGDYTVVCVVDATERSVAQLHRFNGMDYNSQTARLKAIWVRFGRPPIIAEYNSMGGPLVEALEREGLNITGFNTTLASKHEIITALDLALDRKTITLLNDPVLIAELQAYEKKERAGIPSYAAPANQHDDCVMSLAIAWSGVETGQWSVI